MTTIKISPKGELVVPKAVMQAHGFTDGAEVEISGGARNMVLKLVEKAPEKKMLTLEEFLARRIPYSGPPLTDELMSEGILAEAKRRWDEENSR